MMFYHHPVLLARQTFYCPMQGDRGDTLLVKGSNPAMDRHFSTMGPQEYFAHVEYIANPSFLHMAGNRNRVIPPEMPIPAPAGLA
jgi:hypothetical protein